MMLVGRTPDGAQELCMGEYTAGMLSQLCQDTVFLRRQANVLPVAPNATAEQVDFEAIEV